MGKEQRDGRLSVSIWVYFGGELYITLCIRVYSSVYTNYCMRGVFVCSTLLLGVFVFVCTTLLHAGCTKAEEWACHISSSHSFSRIHLKTAS